MTKEKVIEGFRKWISPLAPIRRMLIIKTIGTGIGPASEGRPIFSEPFGKEIDNTFEAYHKFEKLKMWNKV